MADSTTGAATLTIGMDLGDRQSHLCVMDAQGAKVEEARIPTTPEAIQRRFASTPAVRIAIEAGTHSPWVSRLLAGLGHEVIVANPRKLRMIYTNDTKNDRVDAEWLARVARMDPGLLAPIQHRGVQAQADLAALRSRDALVRARTALVNHVRGTVKGVGARLPKCSTRSFGHRVEESIPPQVAAGLMPLLQTIEGLSQQIRSYDQYVEDVAEKRYPETKRLRQVAGVGALTALAYVLRIEDPRRFRNSRTVGSYFGLRPRQDASGQQQPQLRITKAGDEHVRRLLVGSAHYIMGPFGPETDLRRWGLGLAKRGGKNAKKRAAVAVARKLAVLLHRLWITGEEYEPNRVERRKQKTEVKGGQEKGAGM